MFAIIGFVVCIVAGLGLLFAGSLLMMFCSGFGKMESPPVIMVLVGLGLLIFVFSRLNISINW